VDRILSIRTSSAGVTEYFIKWKGWGPKWNTWEPRDNIMDDAVIAKFEAERAAKAAKEAEKVVRSLSSGGAKGAKKRSRASGSSGVPTDGVGGEGLEPPGDPRDASLLMGMQHEWLQKYRQKDLAAAAAINSNTLSMWMNGRLSSVKTVQGLESKLRRFIVGMRDAIESGNSVGLPQPRAKPRASLGAQGRRGRPPKATNDTGLPPNVVPVSEMALQAGGGPHAAAMAKTTDAAADVKEEEPVDEWADYEHSSEGDGEHRIESLLWGRTFQGKDPAK
jgi:hypothetical protein